MNSIHPTAIIDPGVRMGSGNIIGPYAVITGNCVLGNDNWIGAHASIGAPGELRNSPHPAAWRGDKDDGILNIGDRNVIRDSVVIHSGVARGTSLGNDCYIMNSTYIAHDCTIGDFVTISGAMIGGTCTIGRGANLGLNVSVHQRRVIGAGAMVGMGAVVTHDILPFAKAYGSPCRIHGGNSVGMTRNGRTDSEIAEISHALESQDIEALSQLLPLEVAEFISAQAI
jgi:UDP-N-acetylglucosamine acyltransferase